MSSYVRKNLVTIYSTFTPAGWEPFNCQTQQPNPIPTQPTAAQVVLTFCNPGGSQVTQTLPMALGSDGYTWSAQWDSSASRGGLCTWVVFASGAVQAANQGQFTILANRTNTF